MRPLKPFELKLEGQTEPGIELVQVRELKVMQKQQKTVWLRLQQQP